MQHTKVLDPLDPELLDSLDNVCSECIQTIKVVIAKNSAIGAPHEMRDMTMTLCTLERQLFNFVTSTLLRKGSGHKSMLDLSSRSDNLTHVDTRMEGALAKASNADIHTSLLTGGARALLENLRVALKQAKTTTSEVRSQYLQASYKDAFRAVAGMGAFTLLLTRGPVQLSNGVTQAWSRWSVFRSTLPVPPGYLRRFWLVVALLVGWRSWSRSLRMQKVRTCHARLSLLSRIFVLVMDSVHTAKLRCTAESLSLVAEPSHEFDYEDESKTAARLTLEKVPYPTSPYLPLWDVGRMGMLRWGVNMLFSSAGVAWSMSGSRELLAAMITPFTLVYFLLSGSQKQASYATGVRARMSIGLIKFGSKMLNNPVMQFLMIKLMRGVRVHHELRLFGVHTYVFAKSQHPTFAISRAAPPLLPHLEYLKSQQDPTPTLPDVELADGPPAVLYCHGGGFCVSLLTMDFMFIAAAVRESGAVFVVPEYGLAPECPFPGALDHMEVYYRWIVHGGLGFRPSKIVLVGESAGGNILTALVLRLTQQQSESPYPIRQPDALVLGYPTLNLALSPSPSRTLHMCDPFLAFGISVACVSSYVPQTRDATSNILLSPIFADSDLLAKFPQTFISVGGMDPLLDDAVDFHKRLQQAGGNTQLKVFWELPHGYWSLAGWLPEAARAVDLVVQQIHDCCHAE